METDKISQVYALWKDAIIKGDLECLKQVYSDTFLWTNNMGITNSKATVLKKTSSSNIEYVSWEDQNIDIYFRKEIAILKSTQKLGLIVFGQSINAKLDITIHFIRKGNSWLLETINESY